MTLLRRVVSLAALVFAAGCNGGGGKTDPVEVPQNVAATAGYETASLTWSTVAGATGYRVYVATAPNADIETLTPVEIAAPPHVENGLTNWQTRYYRVTALVGARESDVSAEVTATPEGGYLISERKTGASYDVFVYRSDAIALGPVQSITGARLGKVFGDPRVGQAWGVPAAAKFSRLGVFTSSTPTVLGEQAGHIYEFIDLIPSVVPRLAWVDCATTPAQSCSLITSLVDGTDTRTIHSSCDDIVVSAAEVGPQGIAIRCTTGGANSWWFSDGVATANLLTPPVTPDTRTLEALMPTRAIFLDPVTRILTTQPLVASAIEQPLVEAPASNLRYSVEKLGDRAVFGDRIVVRRTDLNVTGFGRYRLLTMNENSYLAGNELQTEITSADLPFLMDVSPDGTRFLALTLFADGAGTNHEISSHLFAPGDVPVQFTDPLDPNADGLDARFAADGTPVLKHDTIGWDFFDGTTGALLADFTSAGEWSWAGTKGAFSFVYQNTPDPGDLQPALGEFLAAKSDGSLVSISGQASAPKAVLRGDGVLLFVDDQNVAWSAIYNSTSNLFEMTEIDSIATTRVQEVGDGPGNRTFLVMTRYDATTPHTDLVVYDIANRAAPAEPLLATPADETGFFIAE